MTRIALAALASLTAAASAQAGGLDRSFQSIAPLFDPSGTFGAQLTYVNPSLEGTDTLGQSYSADESFTTYQWSYVQDVTERFSIGVIGDQPYGLDLNYDAPSASSAIGGTFADLNSDAVSVIGRFKATDRISVFGGLRFQRAGGEIALRGQAYANAFAVNAVATSQGLDPAALGAALGAAAAGDAATVGEFLAATGLTPAQLGALGGVVQSAAADFLAPGVGGASGFEYDLDEDLETGFVFGAAYEIPEIALRASLTYFSEIDYESDSTERFSIGGVLGDGVDIDSTTEFETPQAINLDVQSGVAEGTLVFAGLRWTDWSDFDVIPTQLGTDLADLDDVYRWTLGAARQFTPEFVGLAALTYERSEGDANTPLAPTDGLLGLSLGGRYTRDALSVSGGINYSRLGDVDLEVGGTTVAEWEDNHAIGVSLRVAYQF